MVTTPKYKPKTPFKNADRRYSRYFGTAPYSPLRDYASGSNDNGGEEVITIYSDSEEEEKVLCYSIDNLKNEIRNIECERDNEIDELEKKIEKARNNAEVRIIQIRNYLRKRYERRGAIKMQRAIKKKERELKKIFAETLPKYKDAVIQTERIEQELGTIKCNCCNEDIDVNIGHCTNWKCAHAKCGGCHEYICKCLKNEYLDMTPEELREEAETLPDRATYLKKHFKDLAKEKESKKTKLNNVE